MRQRGQENVQSENAVSEKLRNLYDTEENVFTAERVQKSEGNLTMTSLQDIP
jgi:hypothetical protein